MNILKEKTLLVLLIAVSYMAIMSLAAFSSTLADHKLPAVHNEHGKSGQFSEGPVTQASIIAGPFDLHRRYRSMEGPYIQCNFKVGDLVASERVDLPEGMVIFIEGGGPAPTMMGASGSSKLIQGLVDTSQQPRSLLWLKGAKLEVLDENDKPLPTSEFICHWNLDVSPGFRNKAFPQAEPCGSTRLITITQGQSEVTFPEGFAVPVASDETWNATFQVANRTTDEHRRLKHRCTLYFIKDSDLVYPITALNWYAPFIYVVIDKNSPEAAMPDKANCPSCLGLMPGVNAPNNTTNHVFKDAQGRVLTGHWVVPPGVHSYTTPLGEWIDPGFSLKSRTIHAVWSHIHPFCTSLALYKCDNNTREQVFSNSVKTKAKPGIEIKRIEYLSSKEGILLDKGAHYELEATYNNTSGVPQDSMASAGIFCADSTFARPAWVLEGRPGYSCGVEPPPVAK